MPKKFTLRILPSNKCRAYSTFLSRTKSNRNMLESNKKLYDTILTFQRPIRNARKVRKFLVRTDFYARFYALLMSPTTIILLNRTNVFYDNEKLLSIKGKEKYMKRTLTVDVADRIGEKVKICGRVSNIRIFKEVEFYIIRDRTGEIQAVFESQNAFKKDVKKNAIVEAYGEIISENRAPGGFELIVERIDISSEPLISQPISTESWSKTNIDLELDNRAISLRNPANIDIFELQSAIAKYFRDFFSNQDFVEVFTPKIVSKGVESGSKTFKLNYFGHQVELAQSPQLYKQILVGTQLERVFEIGHAYRAELHDTPRHLNEFISMDVEMSYIDCLDDLLKLEESFLHQLFSEININFKDMLNRRKIEQLPEIKNIPRVAYEELKKMYKKIRKHEVSIKDSNLEKFACDYFMETEKLPLVFITHFPLVQRPFYTKPSDDGVCSESFDLIYSGLEITSGSMRIHQYDLLKESLRKYKIDEGGIKSYLQAFEGGMPKHGGFAIGLERLTSQILNLDNVKLASLFPRDRKRYVP